MDENTQPEANSDELIIQQQRQIEKEISETTPLVSDLQTISTLNSEYNDDAVYCSKVKDLAEKYSSLRKTRPDGNCFFRAFAYGYLEYLVKNKEDYEKFRDLVLKAKDKLVKQGFPELTLEDFHDTFMEVIDRVAPSDNNEENLEELHKLFNEQGYSDYIVVFLRLMTSGQLQEEADFFFNFIEGEITMTEFCHQEVEPMYKESDHIHIIAICKALNANVRVEYMDRADGDKVMAHDFPERNKPNVFLLYRPGHYDILYPK